MSEALKVGVVFRDESPRMFTDLTPEEVPWRIEFFDERPLIQVPVVPRRDFLAIFYPANGTLSAPQQMLLATFPGAELIAYHTQGHAEQPAHEGNGHLRVQFPMPFGVLQRLLESYSITKSCQKELVQVRQREDVLRQLIDGFLNMVESTWSLNDRKLGTTLLINKILTHIQAEECVVYLLNEHAMLHRVHSTSNIKNMDLFDYDANASIVENVLRTGKPYVNNNYSYELKAPFSDESVLIRSVLCYPLERRGETIGAVELLNKSDGCFREDDQNIVRLFSNPLAVGLYAMTMFENAERLTITDDLTKLYNYRYLTQYLESEVKRCLRYKKKVSLLFIDIDGFKKINDTFGHLVGSQALSELGQMLRRILRETDVVGRYGGDEFVIVLPETPLNGAMVIAERIRKKVEDYEFVAQNLCIRLTVSLGVANCPKHTLTAEGLIKKADAAMYRAKELSKNSIKVAV
jgi:diguanylate cyclase (GGDEF)-like protein